MDSPRAAVVVDLASYQHRLRDRLTEAGRAPRGLPEVSLPMLARMVVAHGFTPTSLSVAAPFVTVQTERDSNLDHARRVVARTWQWWDNQTDVWSTTAFKDIPLTLLPGGFDGSREVGVDAMVAAATFEHALEHALGNDEPSTRRADVVLVCSHDSDMFALHRASTGVPIVILGCFDNGESGRLTAERTPSIWVSDDRFRGISGNYRPKETMVHHVTVVSGPADHNADGDAATDAPTVGIAAVKDARPAVKGILAGDVVLVESSDEWSEIISDPINRCVSGSPARTKAAAGSASVAVVDPYGLMNAAIRSIGVGELPDARSMADLVGQLGFDDPTAILATIPDLTKRPMHGIDAARLAAWRNRDHDLDHLSKSLRSDHDELTLAQRALLEPDRMDRSDTYSRDVTGGIKRLTTGLLTDLWIAAAANPRADLIVMTDDPDLAYVLDALPAAGITTLRRTIRIGLHTNRYRLVDGGPARSAAVTAAMVPSSMILLTEAQVAGLVRVTDDAYGLRLRHLLREAVRQGRPVRPAGTDPETGARRVHMAVTTEGAHDEESVDVEALEFDGGERRAETAEPGERDRPPQVAFDPKRPCAHPVLVSQARPTTIGTATVITKDWGHASVDIDGDGNADVSVSTGHSMVRISRGSSVEVAVMDGAWYLLDPGPDAGPGSEPEPVRITAAGDGARCESVEDGVAGPLLPPPGRTSVDAVPGDVVLGVRYERDGKAVWVAMSSALPYLRRMLN